MFENQAFQPTPTVAEFLVKYDQDDNEWWRLQSGDMQNLFDEVVEALVRIANYDLRQARSGMNVSVLQGIAREVLYGDD